MPDYQKAASQLASLYTTGFGGKVSGRYRLSSKQIRQLLGRKRVYADDIALLARAALEQGLVLIDMDSFYVILSANAFVNYRRVSTDALENAMAEVG